MANDSSDNTDAPTDGPAMRPGRNGGKLLAGGKPGNKGGPGVPPSTLRMAHRHKLVKTLEATADAVEAAHAILKDKKSSRSMKLNAAQVIFKGHDAIGKYSGTASVSLTDSDGHDVQLPPINITVEQAKPSEES